MFYLYCNCSCLVWRTFVSWSVHLKKQRQRQIKRQKPTQQIKKDSHIKGKIHSFTFRFDFGEESSGPERDVKWFFIEVSRRERERRGVHRVRHRLIPSRRDLRLIPLRRDHRRFRSIPSRERSSSIHSREIEKRERRSRRYERDSASIGRERERDKERNVQHMSHKTRLLWSLIKRRVFLIT